VVKTETKTVTLKKNFLQTVNDRLTTPGDHLIFKIEGGRLFGLGAYLRTVRKEINIFYFSYEILVLLAYFTLQISFE